MGPAGIEDEERGSELLGPDGCGGVPRLLNPEVVVEVVVVEVDEELEVVVSVDVPVDEPLEDEDEDEPVVVVELPAVPVPVIGFVPVPVTEPVRVDVVEPLLVDDPDDDEPVVVLLLPVPEPVVLVDPLLARLAALLAGRVAAAPEHLILISFKPRASFGFVPGASSSGNV